MNDVTLHTPESAATEGEAAIGTPAPTPQPDTLGRLVELLADALEPRIDQMIKLNVDKMLGSPGFAEHVGELVQDQSKTLVKDLLDEREFSDAVTEVVSNMEFSVEVNNRYGRR